MNTLDLPIIFTIGLGALAALFWLLGRILAELKETRTAAMHLCQVLDYLVRKDGEYPPNTQACRLSEEPLPAEIRKPIT